MGVMQVTREVYVNDKNREQRLVFSILPQSITFRLSIFEEKIDEAMAIDNLNECHSTNFREL